DGLIISLSIFALCLLPHQFTVLALRPAVTLATVYIINCESHDNLILSSKLLGYIGNISYVVYLVHWPVIAIFPPLSTQNYIFLIIIIFVSSITIHHIFEQKYLKLDWKALVPFVFILVLGNVFLQNCIREHSFWNATYPTDVQRIVSMNKAQLPNFWASDPQMKDCTEEVLEDSIEPSRNYGYGHCQHFLFQQGHGNFSIMMLGNSFVLNFMNPIRAHFHQNYSDFRYMSFSGGYAITSDSGESRSSMVVFKKHVEQFKPDVLFIIMKHSYNVLFPILENDPIVQEMEENIKIYEKFAKKIYIMDHFPTFEENFLNRFLQNVINRPDELEPLHINRREHDKVMKFFFDISSMFAEDDKYLTFDRDELLAYADNTGHITAAGVKLCEPVFEKLAKKVMDNV
ncbi:hypothetical protein CRE_27960, partial [Caenorhabditis remanei]